MRIKLYSARIVTLILRFYLLLAVVTIGLFTQQIWMYLVGFGIVFTCMTGMSFEFGKEGKKVSTKKSKVVSFRESDNLKQVG